MNVLSTGLPDLTVYQIIKCKTANQNTTELNHVCETFPDNFFVYI